MVARSAFALVVFLLLTLPAVAQERFESGEFKGFTKYTAFAIVKLRDPIYVRDAKGIVLREGSDEPLADVLVEVRGADGKITATKTDSRGEFKFRALAKGTYMFKTTLNGFQSVVGTIVLEKSAKKAEQIKIEMPLGV